MSGMLQGLLPAPTHRYDRHQEQEDEVELIGEQQQSSSTSSSSSSSARKQIPPYLQRAQYLPLGVEDFGDGGAFPEIHVVQYPLNMSKPGMKSSAVVAVNVAETGEVRFDSIVKQGSNRNRLVQSTLNDIKAAKDGGDRDLLALPGEKEEAETADKTRLALEALVNGKIKSSKPVSGGSVQKDPDEPTYIRYAPDPNAIGFTEGAKQRVIRMVEAQADPMEPPKHQLQKSIRGPPSPPVPVLHSPPRKLTIEDRQAWKIPPCISNWKNARGYTIPLDKRLAADGRGLQEVTINNKFATLSESLYVAERKAAEDLRIRNQIRKKMAMREKEDREKDLRDMALRARMDRAGALDGPLDHEERHEGEGGSYEGEGGGGGVSSSSRVRETHPDDSDLDSDGGPAEGGHEHESADERVARQQRERLRVQRRKERERELRLDNMKGAMRKNRGDRDDGRDVSERIALGMLQGSASTGEAQYDSRLFNQSAGMDSGFGADDEYSTYTKPLFERSEGTSIYRPKRDDADVYGDVDAQMAKLSDVTGRFKPDKGFRGAEGGGRAPREAPVQFERPGADPFGINEIVQGSGASGGGVGGDGSGGAAKKARYD